MALRSVATYHRNALGIPANFTIVNDVEEIKDGRINFIPVFDEEIKVELGVRFRGIGKRWSLGS